MNRWFPTALRKTIGWLPTRGSRLPTAIILLVAGLGISSVVGFVFTDHQVAKLQGFREATRDVRLFQESLVDAETGMRGFLLTQRHEYLRPYMRGTNQLHETSPRMLPRLDAHLITMGPAMNDRTSATETWATLEPLWRQVVRMAEDGKAVDAVVTMEAGRAKPLMDHMRDITGDFLITRNLQADRIGRQIELEQLLGLLLDGAGTLIAVASILRFYRSSRQKAAEREAAIAISEQAHRHVNQLFQMTDMLQSTTTQDDANEVLRATAAGLLPGMSGALYVFNNSRDRLDLSTRWGSGMDKLTDHLAPSQCWALKRGRPHINCNDGESLRCEHSISDHVSLEIPMNARGEIYGLLVVGAADADGADRIRTVQPLVAALADSMSLALSSLALREKLRSQALRDGLTGLYNRRFLEEMRERMLLDAQRREVPLSLIMIDLDHFKQLNDRHGHAAGDAALREVAGLVMSTVRGTDVVCRYGGEELAVLLPDCSLEMAVLKAEQMRVRIEDGTGQSASQRVTASFGVSSIPETASRAGDLFASADEALYRAKQEGRNRVLASPLRKEKLKFPVGI